MSRVHLLIAFGVTIAALALVAAADRPGDSRPHQQQVASFSAVAFSLPAELTLIQTAQPMVSIEGTQQQRDAIELQVVDEQLQIKARKRSGWRDVDLDDVRVQVGYQSLSQLAVAGSGDAVADDIGSDQFSLSVSGSGSALIQSLSAQAVRFSVAGSGTARVNRLDVAETATKIAGSGGIALAGSTSQQTLSIAGSGDYQAGDLASASVQLNIAGSGTATLRASERISGSVAGSGDLFYYGDPDVAVHFSGSGRAEKLGERL